MARYQLGILEAFQILDLEYGASMQEIKRRYRMLAKEWHPDSSKHPNAEQRFSQIAMAYERLIQWDSRGRPSPGQTRFEYLRASAKKEAEEKERKAKRRKELLRKLRLKKEKAEREQAKQYRMAFGILILLAMLYFLSVQFIDWYEEDQIDSHPASTYASIVAQEPYAVHFEFYVNGKRYVDEQRVGFVRNHNKGDNGLPIKQDDRFLVNYSSEDPEYNELNFNQPDLTTFNRYISDAQTDLVELFTSSFGRMNSNDIEIKTRCVALQMFHEFGYDSWADLRYSDESFLDNGANNSITYGNFIEEEAFDKCFENCNVSVPLEVED